jgi:hypothetical protein
VSTLSKPIYITFIKRLMLTTGFKLYCGLLNICNSIR